MCPCITHARMSEIYPMSLQSRYVHHVRSHTHIPHGLVCGLWE